MRSLRGDLRCGFALAALAATLMAGCGSSDSDQPSPSKAQGAEASNTALTVKQYSEIERLYGAMLPFDRLTPRSDPASVRRLTGYVVRSCRQVDKRDPLLAAVVDGCEKTVNGLAAFAAAPECATEQECTGMMKELLTVFRDLIDTARKNKPIIERQISDPACREALLAPEQTAVFEDALPALERFVEALESRDPEQVEMATADMERAFETMENAPSAKEQLKQFRIACQPSV